MAFQLTSNGLLTSWMSLFPLAIFLSLPPQCPQAEALKAELSRANVSLASLRRKSNMPEGQGVGGLINSDLTNLSTTPRGGTEGTQDGGSGSGTGTRARGGAGRSPMVVHVSRVVAKPPPPDADNAI